VHLFGFIIRIFRAHFLLLLLPFLLLSYGLLLGLPSFQNISKFVVIQPTSLTFCIFSFFSTCSFAIFAGKVAFHALCLLSTSPLFSSHNSSISTKDLSPCYCTEDSDEKHQSVVVLGRYAVRTPVVLANSLVHSFVYLCFHRHILEQIV
jgi:hypothetical protein